MAFSAASAPFWPLHNLYWLENRWTSYSFHFHHFSYSDSLDLMLMSAQVHEDWVLASPVNRSWHWVGKKCDLDSCLSSHTAVLVFLPSCARPAGISLFSSDFRRPNRYRTNHIPAQCNLVPKGCSSYHLKKICSTN